MADIGYESKPIESVTGPRSSGGEISGPSPPERVSQKAAGSGESSPAKAETALRDLKKALGDVSSHENVGLNYTVDRETHSVIVKVIDRDTNEVIRQIPSEEMVKLRATMRDLQGLLFKAEV